MGNLGKHHIRRQNSGLPRIEAIARFGSIPIVESGIESVENCYEKIKKSNKILKSYLEAAENAVIVGLDSFRPAIKFFENPIRGFDDIICRSLDLMEQKIPSAYLPPQMILWNTKQYMSSRITQITQKVDSFKNIGLVFLDSRITNFAADRIDGVITVADGYIDKYFPADTKESDGTTQCSSKTGAIKAIQHGQQISRKLKRRITERTIAEARALKKQSKEAIHVLLYAAEMIATNPNQAFDKACDLWLYLSREEPENQARPETLEQLLVMLVRECARRLVHFINFVYAFTVNIPKLFTVATRELIHQLDYSFHLCSKVTRMEELKIGTAKRQRFLLSKINKIYHGINVSTANTLENLAIVLSGRFEAEKITINHTRRMINRTNNNSVQINGVY